MSTGAGAGRDPHLIDNRAAMGLASGCTSRVDVARLRDAMRELVGRSVDQLLVSLREPHADFEIRYAAGTLLGFLGDPRLRPDDPEMVDIPAAEVLVGTPAVEVGEVVSAWSEVGVRQEWITKEVPRHRRRVEAFRIGVYLVTNLEYERFLDDHANTVENGPLRTTPVGTYPAGRSPFGLEDVAGTVEEYTAEDYRPYPGGEHVIDDLATRGDSYRVTRGGSFTRYGDLARCARRHGWYPRDLYAVGFRLAESVTTGEHR
ncbi:MAG: formylglycine-generating enzyme family protein [Pseudonocardiaceae bacterium]